MSGNGSRPPESGDTLPWRARLTHGNLPCAGFGCTGLVLLLIVLSVGIAHPFEVIIAGIVIMAAFGAAMLIWRD